MASSALLRRLPGVACLLASTVLLGGCITRGAIYSHTTQPLTTNFDATPVASDGKAGDVKTVSFYVDVEWGTTGIGEIARQKGMAEIYYADVETTTILGYWKQDVVHIYGRPLETPAEKGTP
jgi:hypothetical protein